MNAVRAILWSSQNGQGQGVGLARQLFGKKCYGVLYYLRDGSLGDYRVMLSGAEEFDLNDAEDGKKGLEALSELSAVTGLKAPAPLSELRTKPLLHDKNVVDKEQMNGFVEAFCDAFSREA